MLEGRGFDVLIAEGMWWAPRGGLEGRGLLRLGEFGWGRQ